MNQDGSPDLVMGQMRAHSWQIDANSKIFINDSKGAFPTSKIINLPAPAFNDGWTKVVDLASGDINRDGLSDLVLIHTRYGSTTPEYSATSWIGTYIQILAQNRNGSFTDESWRLGNQTVWDKATNLSNHYAETVQLMDVNHDGKLDIILGYPWNISPNNSDCPVVFTQSQYGTFAPVDSSFFTKGDANGAKSVVITDLTGNGNIGFISIGSTFSQKGLSVSTADTSGLTSTYVINRVNVNGQNIALDLAPTQAAGQTALLIGAVLPGKLVYDVSKQALLGSVIGLFDQNFTLAQLSGAILRLPIWDVLTGKAAPTTTDIATYLVNNVYGGTQTAAITNAAIAAMNAESGATQGNYLASLAASDANQTHINLVGVQATGLVYLG
jgi:hypothetical protein